MSATKSVSEEFGLTLKRGLEITREIAQKVYSQLSIMTPKNAVSFQHELFSWLDTRFNDSEYPYACYSVGAITAMPPGQIAMLAAREITDEFVATVEKAVHEWDNRNGVGIG